MSQPSSQTNTQSGYRQYTEPPKLNPEPDMEIYSVRTLHSWLAIPC